MINQIKLSLNKRNKPIKEYIPHMYQVQKNSGNNHKMKVFLNKIEKSLVNDIIN